MTFINGIGDLKAEHRPSVVSIGNYDGVHLGHQHVLKTLIEQSKRLNVPSTVITFEPLAKEFFNPEAVVRLTSIEQRADDLFKCGVDQVLCINFTKQFSSCSPDDFVKDVLVDGLGVQYLCVGDDFRFGKDRAGDYAFLQQQGQHYGFEVTAHSTFEHAGDRVSSGMVRAALQQSDFTLVAQLLGRDYAIDGIVSKGQQLGRTIDFPTANVVLGDYQLAIKGVFAVTVQLQDGSVKQGVANVGNRPTVDGKENRVEVHIFDFDVDIYGQSIKVMFHQKIRDEQKFSSIEALQAQIKQDADAARGFFIK